MNVSWLKARQTKYTGYVTVYILVVLAILAGVNFLANRHNKSLDTTSNKRYSLSEQTEKVVKNLEQDVQITLFDQTSRFGPARDLLDRYSGLSPKLSVDYVDPDKSPQAARAAGVTSYGTIYVEAGAKREEAKSVTEEEITNALIRVLKSGVRTVCAVQGSGEHGFDDTGREGYSALKEALESSNYQTRSISLLENPEVPSDCTILLVGGPRFDYVEPVVNAIKSFVTSGGSAWIMLDPPIRFGASSIGENAALAELLAGWGVTLQKNLILDTSGIGNLFGLGPEVPLVTDYGTHAIVRGMRDLATAFPITRAVETSSADGVTVDELFSTTSNSYATTELASNEIKLDRDKAQQGPFNIAAAGTVEAAEKPATEEAGGDAETAAEGAAEEDGPAEGRFVVVGSSGWAANNTLRFNGNRDLALNIANWLSSDEDLISIRPKEPEDRPLTLTSQQMSMVFYASVIFLPLLIIAGGIFVWARRRG